MLCRSCGTPPRSEAERLREAGLSLQVARGGSCSLSVSHESVISRLGAAERDTVYLGLLFVMC